jgi:Pvc16 N-terminal domain
MIYTSLQLLSSQLNEYLRLSFKLKEDIVYLSPVKDQDKVFPSNRVSVSLVGLERETSRGLNFQRTAVSDSAAKLSAPSWQINLQVLISAIFQDKQYEEALQIFSGILRFIQKNNMVTSQNNATSFSIDVLNLSAQELANLWGVCGGSYYPSILCRLRLLAVDEAEILELSGVMRSSELNSGIKKEN